MPKIRLFCNESLEEKKEINIDGDNFHYLAAQILVRKLFLSFCPFNKELEKHQIFRMRNFKVFAGIENVFI